MEQDSIEVARVVTPEAILVYVVAISMAILCMVLSIFTCIQWYCEKCCPGPDYKQLGKGCKINSWI
jgi:hypothetical protein